MAIIDDALARRALLRLLYANAHLLNQLRDEPAIAEQFRGADAIICDGFGAALAVRLLHGVRPSRQTPPDWVHRLAALCAARGAKLFLLGSTEPSMRGAAAHLSERHPGLRVAGARDGYFDHALGSADNEAVVAAINASGARVLLVTFGLPLQERWIRKNRHRLDCEVVIAVGAMFDFLSGEVTRGPRIRTDHGLEWLTRLVFEPRRLRRRYLVGLPVFFARVARQSLRSGSR